MTQTHDQLMEKAVEVTNTLDEQVWPIASQMVDLINENLEGEPTITVYWLVMNLFLNLVAIDRDRMEQMPESLTNFADQCHLMKAVMLQALIVEDPDHRVH